jgi:hypothetical protein
LLRRAARGGRAGGGRKIDKMVSVLFPEETTRRNDHAISPKRRVKRRVTLGSPASSFLRKVDDARADFLAKVV